MIVTLHDNILKMKYEYKKNCLWRLIFYSLFRLAFDENIYLIYISLDIFSFRVFSKSYQIINLPWGSAYSSDLAYYLLFKKTKKNIIFSENLTASFRDKILCELICVPYCIVKVRSISFVLVRSAMIPSFCIQKLIELFEIKCLIIYCYI